MSDIRNYASACGHLEGATKVAQIQLHSAIRRLDRVIVESTNETGVLDPSKTKYTITDLHEVAVLLRRLDEYMGKSVTDAEAKLTT